MHLFPLFAYHMNILRRPCLWSLLRFFLSFACVVIITTQTTKAETATIGESTQSIEQQIDAVRAALPQSLDVKEIVPLVGTPFYRLRLNDDTLVFTTADASSFLVGDIFVLKNERFINLSESLLNRERLAMLEEVAFDDMIIFPADGDTRGIMYVFTDIDCGYCRRLHQEIASYQSLGIEIRYLAWPRCGVGSNCPSYQKAVNVWCAEDRQQAMTRAKAGQNVPYAKCANPVREQFALGRKLGIQGTPFMMLDNGVGIPGYQPATSVVELL